MDYLKLFDTHAQYNDFVGVGGMLRPNVSYCIQENEVHYNDVLNPLIAKFNVTSTASTKHLYTDFYQYLATDLFNKIEVDGTEISLTELNSNGGVYNDMAQGEHIVKYYLKNEEVMSYGMFIYCDGIVEITIPKTVKTIEDEIMQGTNITSLIIPDNVNTIGNQAFAGCGYLTAVTVGTGFEYDGGYGLFLNCPLTTVSLNVKRITNDLMEIFNSETITSITFGDNTEIIDNWALSTFNRRPMLTSVTIGNNVSTIGNYGFSGCVSLSSITIPQSVVSIGEHAFSDCNELSSITFLSNTLSIGDYAFCECSNLNTASRNAISAINPIALECE